MRRNARTGPDGPELKAWKLSSRSSQYTEEKGR